MGDPKAEPEDSLGALREAAPGDDLERAVAKARVAASLFGDIEPIKIGRYALIERAGAGGMGVVWSAYDTELDRPVALKLATSGDEATRARARDEGRALAKLSHPNVVPIYDVVDVEQGVFLVMELVEGQTLRQVTNETPLAIVRAYRQAGDGLAAAHAAGLIHRDFKPDNAILGADGRVRVLDFGLAAAAADATNIAGTPRYMAPEQREGKPLTAAVDQFALCTSLAESLGTVPRWLEPIIARGTADDPASRYSSMDALLAALALDPRTRWRRRALIGGAAISVVAVVLAFTVGRAARDVSACEGGPALIAASWVTPRTAIAQHFASLGTPYAQATTPRLLATIDRYTGGWLRVHRASCEAHRRGEISADLLDRRAGCLARRRGALATIGELAGKLALADLPNFEIAVGELPDVATCEDDAALVANVPPPRPEIRAEAMAIAELAARADVERDAGRYADATVDADAALARARALGYRPLVARTLMSRGRIKLSLKADDRGAALFDECIREALASGDEPLAIEAFARRAWAIATVDGTADATDGLPIIEAILERVGDNARFARALLRLNLTGVAQARGDRPLARSLLDGALAEAAAFKGGGAIELTGVLETAIQLADDPVERDRRVAELVALRTELLGASHPSTLNAAYLGGNLDDDVDRARTVMWRACQNIAAEQPGEVGLLNECGYEVMWLATMIGDHALARDAAAVIEATRGKGGDPVALVAATACASLVAGDRDAARAQFVTMGAMLASEPSFWRDYYMGDAAAGEAISAANPADAQRAFARARAHYAKLTAKATPALLTRRDAALRRAGAI